MTGRKLCGEAFELSARLLTGAVLTALVDREYLHSASFWVGFVAFTLAFRRIEYMWRRT